MPTLRQRKSTPSAALPDVSANASSKHHSVSIDTSTGHLGVTLSTSSGALVTELDQADLVYKAGLRVGDVITSVKGVYVKDHEETFKILNEAAGTTVDFEYMTAAEVAAECKASQAALWASRSRICKRFTQIIFGLLLTALAGSVVAYKVLPQRTFKDHVDTLVLPRLGYEMPKIGMDGLPEWTVVPPKDPTKPWTVPGWNRKLEMDAIHRIKNTELFKVGLIQDESSDNKESERFEEIMLQVRASRGELVNALEAMSKEWQMGEEMMRGMGQGMHQL